MHRAMQNREHTVVCDNGTGFVKCGFAGDNFPRATFPCMVGRPLLRYEEEISASQLKARLSRTPPERAHRSESVAGSSSPQRIPPRSADLSRCLSQDIMVGDDCAAHRHNLEVTYPVNNGATARWLWRGCPLSLTTLRCEGIVNNWEDMEHVWDHTFYERLRIDPTQCNILLTGAQTAQTGAQPLPSFAHALRPSDPPLNPKANRERMVGTMFEKYGFAGAFIQVQAVLTLYAQGLLTGAFNGNAARVTAADSWGARSGLVVDSGDGVTHVVPVVARPRCSASVSALGSLSHSLRLCRTATPSRISPSASTWLGATSPRT